MKNKKIIIYLFSVFILLFILFISTFLYSRSWKRGFFMDPFYEIQTQNKLAALTFDDGPSQTLTPVLLKLLEKYHIQATFFMLGENIKKYPDIARAVYQKGHLIGSHSYNHPRLIFKTPSFIKDQVLKTDELIKTTGQVEIKYFRPPYSSKYIILPLVLQSLNKKLVTGTYDPPSEYIVPYDPQRVANEVIENTKPGSIIYLHDGRNIEIEAFLKSIELIIIGLKQKGYDFIKIDYKS